MGITDKKMNMDNRSRTKEFTQISPYFGYTFEDKPSCLNVNGAIYSPAYDDPVSKMSLTKMRQNLFCLNNPKTFKETNKGLYHFQKNNTFVVPKNDSQNATERMEGFTLQELPLSIQKREID